MTKTKNGASIILLAVTLMAGLILIKGGKYSSTQNGDDTEKVTLIAQYDKNRSMDIHVVIVLNGIVDGPNKVDKSKFPGLWDRTFDLPRGTKIKFEVIQTGFGEITCAIHAGKLAKREAYDFTSGPVATCEYEV